MRLFLENAPTEIFDDTVERSAALRTRYVENRGDGQTDPPTFADGNLPPLVGEPRHQLRQPHIPDKLTIDPRLGLGPPIVSPAGIVQRTPEQEGESECAAHVVGPRKLGVMPIENGADRLFRQPVRKRRTRGRAACEGARHCRPEFFGKSLHRSIYAMSEPQWPPIPV